MARQPKHLEQLNRLAVYIGKDNQRAVLFSDIDDAEQDRYADAVYQLSIAEINYQRAGAGVELLLTFAFDPFAGKLVQVVACINDSRSADAVRANV